MIGKFETPQRGKCAIDFERVEAITTDENKPGCVSIVTHNDVYNIIADFDDVVDKWIEYQRGKP
jgi:hypothetical protein